MRFALLLLLLALMAPAAHAQREGLLITDDDLHHALDRQRALGQLPGAFLGVKPLSAYAARAYADSVLVADSTGRLGLALSRGDRALLARATGRVDGPGTAFVRRHVPFLYTDGAAFYSAQGEDFAVEFTPLAYLSLGRARQARAGAPDTTVSVWQNTRGMRAAGHLGRHLYFDARLEENQRRVVWPEFTRRTYTAPRLGFIKYPEEGVYDYFFATGIVGLRSKHFDVRFGRHRNRWGFGRGGLFLSEYAAVYDQLQIRTQFWRIHYTNLFTRFTDPRPESDERVDTILPSKYGTFHRLAIDLPGRVQFELFEAVIFATDTTGAGRRPGFDVGYLNPIMFYRAVEGDLGSPDNVVLGAGISWVAYPGVEVYGQALIDELRVREFRKDWWGNKWAYLVGLYLVDPGIGEARLRDFDLRVEYARQRPYLHGHRTMATAYLHYGDLLGHPAGPNTSDVAVSARYRPWPRLAAALDLALTRHGRDPDGKNWGANPALSYETRDRERDYLAATLQGVRQNLVLVEARVGYELLPSLFAEAALRVESVDDAERGTERYVSPFVSLRWGLPFQSERW